MFGGGPFGATYFGGVFPTLPDPLPTILLQAVVTRGRTTDEGQLIIAVAPAWHAIVDVLRRDPAKMFEIPPRGWEEMIAGYYEREGFPKVTLTPGSGDRGRDVIAEKPGWGAVRIVDQVKAYAPGHLVTADDVRALGFVMLSDRAATKGIVTTT